MSNVDVFVNCPFDEAFKAAFEAMVFTITASGYKVRCALEDNDSGDIRYDKLCRLIAASDRTVHDLSRTELGASGLPRFNMPFELGLMMGARRFGGRRQKTKTALIMVTEPYKLPVYLSDLAGSDPFAHHGQPREVIRIVRRYLHAHPDGTPLPGAARILADFERFQASLPQIAAALHLQADEIDAFQEYRTYIDVLAAFLMQS